MQDLITTPQDYSRLVWSERANTSGTAGTFLKSRESGPKGTVYYKLSCYDSYRGIYGHECVNELIASRLMTALGVSHVDYRLVNAQVVIDGKPFQTWMSASDSFREPGEQKQPLDLFFDLNRQGGESPLQLCERLGWKPYIDQMLVVDFLAANRDRHGANIEVLSSGDAAIRLAPIFDSGLSFVFSAYGDEARADAFDPMEDVNANNYLGTRSLFENLKFIDDPVAIDGLDEEKLAAVFEGIDEVLPAAHCEKIERMIRLRWNYLVNEGHVKGGLL